MRDYDIKRGHFKNIDGKLEDIAKDIFGETKKKGDKIVTSFGAIKSLEMWFEGKTVFWVDMEMIKDVDDDTAMATQKKYNDLLFRITGFTGKQRLKRLKEKAKKGTL